MPVGSQPDSALESDSSDSDDDGPGGIFGAMSGGATAGGGGTDASEGAAGQPLAPSALIAAISGRVIDFSSRSSGGDTGATTSAGGFAGLSRVVEDGDGDDDEDETAGVDVTGCSDFAAAAALARAASRPDFIETALAPLARRVARDSLAKHGQSARQLPEAAAALATVRAHRASLSLFELYKQFGEEGTRMPPVLAAAAQGEPVDFVRAVAAMVLPQQPSVEPGAPSVPCMLSDAEVTALYRFAQDARLSNAALLH